MLQNNLAQVIKKIFNHIDVYQYRITKLIDYLNINIVNEILMK